MEERGWVLLGREGGRCNPGNRGGGGTLVEAEIFFGRIGCLLPLVMGEALPGRGGGMGTL